MKSSSIRVVVAYARPGRQALRDLVLADGATVAQAVSASGLLDEFPEIDLSRNKVGIFGRLASFGATLRDGDRVEIYRPLALAPMEARRRRASSKRNAA